LLTEIPNVCSSRTAILARRQKMTTKNTDPELQSVTEAQPLNRRRALRILGTLAAAAAGAAALSSTRPETAEATNFPVQYSDDPTLEAVQYPASPVFMQAASGFSTTFTPEVLRVVGASGVGGIYGTNLGGSTPGIVGESDGSLSAGVRGNNGGGGDGVHGQSNGGGTQAGVRGVSSGSQGNGVWGECDNGTGAYGVYGISTTGLGVVGQGPQAGVRGVAATSTSTGVVGESSTGIGVWGVTSSAGQGLANPAVAGSNDGGGAALVGFTTGPQSIGLGGATDSGIGVYGSSQTGIGVSGYTKSSVAVGGTATGGGYAGYFNGPVYINGSLTATGAKSAAVRSNGSLRRVYSLECPESWFEDFGTAQLASGQTTVSLEPGFASIVHTDAYRVFLTPKGDCKGLYVSSQAGGTFNVHELQGGTSNIGFDYRVVARRSDIAGARLEDVDEPPSYYQPPEPALDHAPKPAPPDTQGDHSKR
jgi:hypothetical protein